MAGPTLSHYSHCCCSYKDSSLPTRQKFRSVQYYSVGSRTNDSQSQSIKNDFNFNTISSSKPLTQCQPCYGRVDDRRWVVCHYQTAALSTTSNSSSTKPSWSFDVQTQNIYRSAAVCFRCCRQKNNCVQWMLMQATSIAERHCPFFRSFSRPWH